MDDLEYYDYKSELSIDPDALDIEWLGQSALFMKYAEALAKARKDVDTTKDKLELVKAEICNDIRENPDIYTSSNKKPTESHIASLINISPDYKKAVKEVNEAKYMADVLSLAVRAFEQRKSALENLVKLHGQSYFSGPVEPRDLGVEFSKKASKKAANTKVNSKLNYTLVPNSELQQS